MEVVKLPAAKEQQLRARQLSATRRIFRIGVQDMAGRVSSALDEMELRPYFVVGNDILRMETGEIPVPLPVACAAAQVLDDGLAMLDELIESLRQVRGEPSWPFPEHQVEAG